MGNKWIEENYSYLAGISDKIWENPELKFEEYQSCELLAKELEKHGFQVERKAFGLDTAFRAQWGSGSPVIGYLAEYDCLPGLSQKTVPYKDPVKEGAPGHGCGHNLLGTSNFGAAVDLRYTLEAQGLQGTVVCYGTPAEEGGNGKIKMAAKGAFRELDIVLSSHPCIANFVSEGSASSIISAEFTFKGITSHAAASPENGRSALDALELMHVGINYLREHISRDTRIHYITKEGGIASNIVPDRAVSSLSVRAATIDDAREVFRRICLVAEGAATMTETQVEHRITGGCYNYIVNYTVAEVMHKAMTDIGGIRWSEEELDFARELSKDYSKAQKEGSIINYVTKQNLKHLEGKVLDDGVVPLIGYSFFSPGSSDITDVSWIVPTGVCETSCRPIGAAAHTWEQTACAGMSIGHKGMIFCAKSLANTGYEFIKNPELVKKAKAELLEVTGGREYVPVFED